MTRLIRVGVIDAIDPVKVARLPPAGSPPDLRVSAITPASQQLLQACGAWASLDMTRVRPYTHMQVWDSQGSGCMQFGAQTQTVAKPTPWLCEQSPPLGYIVENTHLQAALLRRLQVGYNL